jgi:hypothetical protein
MYPNWTFWFENKPSGNPDESDLRTPPPHTKVHTSELTNVWVRHFLTCIYILNIFGQSFDFLKNKSICTTQQDCRAFPKQFAGTLTRVFRSRGGCNATAPRRHGRPFFFHFLHFTAGCEKSDRTFPSLVFDRRSGRLGSWKKNFNGKKMANVVNFFVRKNLCGGKTIEILVLECACLSCSCKHFGQKKC